MNPDSIEEILRRKNPRVGNRRVRVLLTEYEARKIPKALEGREISFSELQRERADDEEARLSALRPKRKTSYADILDKRKRDRRDALEKRRRDREVNVRTKRYTSVSQGVVLKDADYPTIAPGETTRFDRHADAYTGPWDEAEWGPKGRLYEWHRSIGHTEALPMTEFTLFSD
jgi:hypothetical protein